MSARLLRHTHGFTSNPREAIDNLEPIDTAHQATYCQTGRKHDNEREHNKHLALANYAQRLADHAASLDKLLHETHHIDRSTHSRARRAKHDLERITHELTTM